MALSFPILNQTHIILKVAGRYIQVPMLPVKAIDTLDSLREKTFEALNNGDNEALITIKNEMLELAYTVVPKELELQRLTVEQIFELLAYLIYGEETEKIDKTENEDVESKKKVE